MRAASSSAGALNFALHPLIVMEGRHSYKGRMSEAIPFRKMNGLGNEIVVVDLRGSTRVLASAEARAIAERPASHFDQMMVLHPPKTAGTAAFVRIYNTDGSDAEACGNGTRCIAWLVAEQTGRRTLQFETVAGVLDVSVG